MNSVSHFLLHLPYKMEQLLIYTFLLHAENVPTKSYLCHPIIQSQVLDRSPPYKSGLARMLLSSSPHLWSTRESALIMLSHDHWKSSQLFIKTLFKVRGGTKNYIVPRLNDIG